MGRLSDEHNAWLDEQALQARLDDDPDLRDILAKVWSMGYNTGWDHGRHAQEGKASNPYED